MFLNRKGSFNLKLIQLLLISIFVSVSFMGSVLGQEVTDSPPQNASIFPDVDFSELSSRSEEFINQAERFTQMATESEVSELAQNQLALASIGMRIHYLELIFELEKNNCFDGNRANTEACSRTERMRERIANGMGYLVTIGSVLGGSIASRATYGRLRGLLSIDASIRPVRLRMTTTSGIRDILRLGTVWLVTSYTSAVASYNAWEIHFMPDERRLELLSELRTARMALQWVEVNPLRETMIAWRGELSDQEIEEAVNVYKEASNWRSE